jgi:hypothetical protein
MTVSNTNPSSPRRKLWLQRLAAVALGGVLFVYGLGVGHYKWPPFELIAAVKTALTQWVPAPVAEYRGEQELLQYAFTDPVTETDLYHPPITSLEGIRQANERIFMRREGFETAYRDLELIDAQQMVRPAGAQPVVKVGFRYQGRDHEAFAYGRLPAASDNPGTAALIIPGSGLNQSLGIATGDPANYHHGILDSLYGGGVNRSYTFIKPNEDYLAWHDGRGKKLSGSFIWNWHLNREGSYSVSYLVETLAFIKWMKDRFDTTIVAGLSQGGAATLLNSIQSHPTLAIVASGYSTINETVQWSGPGTQLHAVPGYGHLSAARTIRDALQESRSSWLFTWGKAETGTYRIEAEEQITGNALRNLANVEMVIHEAGHVFPVTEIQAFIEQRLLNAQRPR